MTMFGLRLLAQAPYERPQTTALIQHHDWMTGPRVRSPGSPSLALDGGAEGRAVSQQLINYSLVDGAGLPFSIDGGNGTASDCRYCC